MENGIKIFEKAEFGKVRVVEHEGQPWFVVKDVCECLGLENSNKAILGLEEDEKATLTKIHCLNNYEGLRKDTLLVNEAGLYSLIIRSNKPEAKNFKRWVTHEVLPSIRKTGGYGNALVLPDFTNPVEAARAWADEREGKELAQATASAAIAERDHALRTKAQIGSKREASALGLLSAEKRRSEHYAEQLGIGRSWRAVKAIPWVLDVFSSSRGMWSVLGRKLKDCSKELGYEVRQIDDEHYGQVNAYHVAAIDAFRKRLDAIPEMMGRYRRARLPM